MLPAGNRHVVITRVRRVAAVVRFRPTDLNFAGSRPKLAASPEPDLSAALTGGLEEFTSPASINEFLSRLLLLLSQNRISPRRAAVLAFITSQILRTIAVMEAAAARNEKNRPVNIIWDLPCPPREQIPDPLPSLSPQPSGPGASGAGAVSPQRHVRNEILAGRGFNRDRKHAVAVRLQPLAIQAARQRSSLGHIAGHSAGGGRPDTVGQLHRAYYSP